MLVLDFLSKCSYSCKVSPGLSARVIESSRGVFNKLLPDVRIFQDHVRGKQSGLYDFV